MNAIRYRSCVQMENVSTLLEVTSCRCDPGYGQDEEGTSCKGNNNNVEK